MTHTPFDCEYVHAYLETVLEEAAGNADPEVQKLLDWLRDYTPRYTAEQRGELAKLAVNE